MLLLRARVLVTRVLFLPDFGARNPYQRELRAALESRGVSVSGEPVGRHTFLEILRAWLSHGRPDVIHQHWTHNFLGQRANGTVARFGRLRAALFLGQLRLLRVLGVRVVWTVHNLGHHERLGDGGQDMRVHKRLVGIADAVICHCDAAADAVTHEYGLAERDRRKLHVIPHGNYVHAYGPLVDRATARDRLGLPADARILLFVGAIRAYKGVGDLMSAFGQLRDPDLRLVIAGRPFGARTGPALEAQAATDPRVDLRLGFVPDDELPVLLGAADVVVLPFRDILTSGSAVLAMSYARAVVAPSLGCLPETLDHEGAVLYDAQSPDGLVHALGDALARDLEAMGAHNAERAQRLAWGPIAAATAALYRAS